MKARYVFRTYPVVLLMGVVISSGTVQAVCKKKTVGYFQLIQTAGVAAVGPALGAAFGGVKQIVQPLTSTPGDTQSGRKLVVDRKKGNCLACHRIAALKSEPFHGELGPRLDNVGTKYSAGQLRQFVVDSRVFNPRTPMPSFFIKTGLKRVAKKFRDRTILSAQEVEDIVAYMKTLR